jgi:hypothetical protein
MEMKAQLEAAKEEKRRQELLAERKAQHVEATMRFQRGIKNFKLNKGSIFVKLIIQNVFIFIYNITFNEQKRSIWTTCSRQ